MDWKASCRSDWLEMQKTKVMNPVFIVGSPRSGTTLLQSLINALPHIAIPPEEDLIVRLFPRFGDLTAFDYKTINSFCSALASSDSFVNWGLDREIIRQQLQDHRYSSYSELISALYLIYARRLGGSKSRWGVKVPFYVNHLPLLYHLFPSIKVIHIIRDGRDVLISMRDRENKGAQHFQTRVTIAALQWKKQVTRGYKTGRHLGPHHYREIKYEDLVGNPQSVLKELCSFLDEEYSEHVFKYYEIGSRVFLNMNLDNYLLKGITKARTERWKEDLSENALLVYESIAHRVLKKYGYEISYDKIPLRTAVLGQTVSALYRLYGSLRRALHPSI